ncbi:zinc finger protein 492-like isoform X2 [Zootermopsis nevadensis]|nr:zinc finger protein 492-like isoform X2 [Zootermopsis nevadensis]XP_021926632.1 zinc finger protein 492-like isoform X2 [Zootermopsis nevadensis]XP_021926633.1 zinc finger protein 492-like isoform X2 [Zootermopsis nevadensis]XP_021926634.1 zinc finger protein 492-like isoform X2 [Zootermopsis nevadensis]XP_021926635.1 zinc finger protein 492-like isoform X2 [Zootermopsis nevadensis]XP_021926636.1 zinc finger protein 492-like isoform X2 [Zootermopsis nevadensis]XP_021926637.1 zinc finger pr
MAVNFQEIKFIQLFLIKDKDVTLTGDSSSPQTYTLDVNAGHVIQESSNMLPSRGIHLSSNSDEKNCASVSSSPQRLSKCLMCDKIFLNHGIPATEVPRHCSDCMKKFNMPHFLESQDVSVVSNKPCKCTTCGKAFRYMSSLNRHVVVHSGEKRYTCSVCNKAFTQKAHLKTHASMHTGEKPFQCPVCNMAFSRKGNLKRHLQVHKGVKFYECDACKPRPVQRSN